MLNLLTGHFYEFIYFVYSKPIWDHLYFYELKSKLIGDLNHFCRLLSPSQNVA